MKRLTLLLTIMAALVPAGAQASIPCSKGTKVVPPDQCAFWNMAEAAGHQGYANPSFRSFYVRQTPIGKYHSVWAGWVSFPGKPIRFTLTARRCGNTYVVYNHRKRAWWPRAC